MNPFKGRAALVIGGTGFLGTRLVDRLLREGCGVSVLGRDSSRLRPPLSGRRGLLLLTADLSDPISVSAAVAAARPDYVFMLAKIRDLRSAVRATLAVAQAACRRPGGLKRFVRTGFAQEDSSALGADESLHEALGGKYSLPVVTLRLYRVYGDGQEPTDLIPSLVRQARRGDILSPPPDSADDGPQDLVHVDDAVAAFLLAATRPRAVGRVISIGSGLARRQRRIAAEVARALSPLAGRRLTIRWNEEAAGAGAAARPAAALRLLGWKPKVSLAQGVRRMWRARAEAVPARPRNSGTRDRA